MTKPETAKWEDGPAAVRPAAPGHAGLDSLLLSDAQAQSLLRLLEAAPEVNRRFQFFVWLQSHVDALLPHVLAVCGAYQRGRHSLQFDVFNSIAVPPALLNLLGDSESALMSGVAQSWIDGHGRPLLLEFGSAAWAGLGVDAAVTREFGKLGLSHFVAHGVARPERTHEIETLFMFGGRGRPGKAGLAQVFDLLMPHLHSIYLRTRSFDRELATGSASVPTSSSGHRGAQISTRERQILQSVREGMTNQQIAELLGISALTVKNHVQNILRKLGASNRAHAVAVALRSRLLPMSDELSALTQPGDFDGQGSKAR